MTLQKELINGVACVTDSSAPGVAVTNLAQDGGDIVALNAERLSNVYASLMAVNLSIPDRIYAATGREMSCYFANVMRAAAPNLVWHDVTCVLGTQQNERWTYTAADGDVTSGNIRDLSWKLEAMIGPSLITSKTTTLRVAKSTAGTGVARKMLVFGDSTSYSWLPELMNLFDGDAMTLTLVGDHSVTANDSEGGSRTAVHEGIGGWTWLYLNNVQSIEAGDASSQCSTWRLAGHKAENTDNGYLYWKLVNDLGPELVLNGTFESVVGNDFAGWNEQFTTGAVADTATAHGGSHAVKVTNGGVNWFRGSVYQVITVQPSKTYTLAMWVRGDGTNAPAFACFNATSGSYFVGSTSAGHTTGVTGTDYTLFTYDFTTPATCTSMYLYLGGPLVNGAESYFDDVSVKAKNTRYVTVYKNSDGAVGNAVASGSLNGDGTITLTQENASGLSGSVVVAYTADDTTVSANTLRINFGIRNGASTFDFATYMTDTGNSVSADDWVLFHLGINDVFGLTTDAAVSAYITGTIQPALEAVVGIGATPAATTVRGAVSGVRVGLVLPIPPSQDQDAFGVDYTSGQTRIRYKRNIDLLREWLIATYGSLEASDIYLVPVHMNLDTYYNMQFAGAAAINARTATTAARQDNGVHPDVEGYYQIADSVYCFLKGMET
jgi:hypothetical protein